jgi:O-antigen/teichoic acid export membrane protein
MSIYAIGSMAAALLSFITLPILAWTFSQADVGRIVMLQVFCSLVVVVVSLGLDQAFVREYNEGLDQASLAKTCLYPGAVVLSVFIILASFYHERLTAFLFGGSNSLVFIVVVLSLIALYFERFFSVFIRMKELAIPYVLTKIIPKLMLLALVILIYFSNLERNFLLLSIAQVICWLSVVIVSIVLMAKFLLAVVRSPYLSEKKANLLSFGLPLVVSGMAFWGLNYVDRIMLGHYASFSEVGLYSVASSFAGAAILFQQIFSTIWHPLLYKWSANDNVDELKFHTISEGIQLFSFLLISIAGLFSWLLPYFLPTNYELVQYIFMSCLIYPLFLVISEVNGAGIALMRKTMYLPLITGLALAVNVCLNFLLIPEYGASGAAAATAISIFIFCSVKSEVAMFVWRSGSRAKFYMVGGFMVSACVIYCLFGSAASPYTVLFWGAIIPVLLVLYKDSSMQFLSYVLRRS